MTRGQRGGGEILRAASSATAFAMHRGVTLTAVSIGEHAEPVREPARQVGSPEPTLVLR
jgi:hypothetical protein